MPHLESQAKMSDALFDLEELFRSRKGKETLTIQESNMLISWRSQVMRDMTIGFSGANLVSILEAFRLAVMREKQGSICHRIIHCAFVACVMYACARMLAPMIYSIVMETTASNKATQRLNNLVRVGLSLGASVFCAMWSFGRSVESCAERFLSLEGSRIQRELANIMLRKYSDDPWILRHLSKHFYFEEVYEDSSADKPKFRCHRRNFYGDPASHSHSASYNEIKTDSIKNDVKKTIVESKDVNVNTAVDAFPNPFDFVFGLPGNPENIPSPIMSSSTSPGRSRLKERRSRSRRRRHHQEDSDV